MSGIMLIGKFTKHVSDETQVEIAGVPYTAVISAGALTISHDSKKYFDEMETLVHQINVFVDASLGSGNDTHYAMIDAYEKKLNRIQKINKMTGAENHTFTFPAGSSAKIHDVDVRWLPRMQICNLH